MGRRAGWTKCTVTDLGRECSKCGKYKEWSKYANLKHGIRGYHSQCRECAKVYANKWYHKYPDKHLKLMQDRKDSFPGGVYRIITSIGTYIGQSSAMEWRVVNHLTPKSNSPVTKEVFKEWEVLEYIEDPVLRLERERYYIDTLKPELNTL